jgi:hypothetical protein
MVQYCVEPHHFEAPPAPGEEEKDAAPILILYSLLSAQFENGYFCFYLELV